ncbi:MAG: D-alanine--D-alanine ligase [Firmicutes bacterium]|nr:D-alanine--D-alanine ligase [Bacillota bacterium]
MKKIRLAVVFGGRSSEHEVSLRSAASVIENLDKEKYEIIMIGITRDGRWLLFDGPASALKDGSWQKKAEEDLAKDPGKYGFSVFGGSIRQLSDMADFALPMIHGQNGEDGSLQGIFRQMDIPFGGSDVTSSSLCFDKSLAKLVCSAAGIPQTPSVFLKSREIGEEKIREINEKLRYPLFVKPANMGSSVGISKVSEPSGLMDALKLAAGYDDRILVEQGVKGRELEVAVMGNDRPVAIEIGEIIAAGDFYTYESKYDDRGSETVVGAELPEGKREELLRLAERVYELLDCGGYARADFFMDEDGNFIFNEINTIPGFTSISMFPMLASSKDMDYSQVIDRIIELGFERYEKKKSLRI